MDSVGIFLVKLAGRIGIEVDVIRNIENVISYLKPKR